MRPRRGVRPVRLGRRAPRPTRRRPTSTAPTFTPAATCTRSASSGSAGTRLVRLRPDNPVDDRAGVHVRVQRGREAQGPLRRRRRRSARRRVATNTKITFKTEQVRASHGRDDRRQRRRRARPQDRVTFNRHRLRARRRASSRRRPRLRVARHAECSISAGAGATSAIAPATSTRWRLGAHPRRQLRAGHRVHVHAEGRRDRRRRVRRDVHAGCRQGDHVEDRSRPRSRSPRSTPANGATVTKATPTSATSIDAQRSTRRWIPATLAADDRLHHRRRRSRHATGGQRPRSCEPSNAGTSLLARSRPTARARRPATTPSRSRRARQITDSARANDYTQAADRVIKFTVVEAPSLAPCLVPLRRRP